MIRSLAAIIVATVSGLAFAKFLEGLIGGGVSEGGLLIRAEQAGLVIGYFGGAVLASGLSLLIGQRWAPLGWLGAATILFAATLTLLGARAPWCLWPLSAIACAAGGWIAVRALKAPMAYPQKPQREKLFD